jgi:predicted DsbA family dithiol-disulfide isomerase
MYLGSATDIQAVERMEQEVRNAGVDIVPFFIFNGKVTVAGAHEVKVLLEAMEMATTGETASVVE